MNLPSIISGFSFCRMACITSATFKVRALKLRARFHFSFVCRIKDTMNVPEDHTFGIIVKPDGFGVDDLLHGRVPKHYLRGKDRERALTAAVRANLKNHNFNRFDDIAAAFMTYDKVRSQSCSCTAEFSHR